MSKLLGLRSGVPVRVITALQCAGIDAVRARLTEGAHSALVPRPGLFFTPEDGDPTIAWLHTMDGCGRVLALGQG